VKSSEKSGEQARRLYFERSSNGRTLGSEPGKCTFESYSLSEMKKVRYCPSCRKSETSSTCSQCGAKTIVLFDADGALSREFLLARGTCCDSGCKNCPYRKK
jgi:hypothetical protein